MSFGAPAEAKDLRAAYETITAANFDQEYQKASDTYQSLFDQTTPRLRRTFKRSKGKNIKRMSKKQVLLKQAYEKASERKAELEPIVELRDELIGLYKSQNKNASFDEAALQKESTELAVGFIKEIARLKKKYKSIFIPIFHNMMIDVGVRKRGACKHWAEDLLEFGRPFDRQFFDLAWGEANMQKMTEHNVAVVIPKGSPFSKGLIIDPWRTSGKPFWVHVTKDKHYKWSQWTDYGTF